MLGETSENQKPVASTTSKTEHLPVVVIGAGFGGLALAAQLRKQGIEDFTILERGAEVGGTWRDNNYPGCACDVASNLYSLSFAPNPNWSRSYGRQPEIFAYLKQVADDLNVRGRIRFGHELLEASWDDGAQRWHLRTNQGGLTAGALVTATGPFGSPQLPNIAGRESFAGKAFHSLHWDHDYDLSGKRVAVIGTGATAAQVVPAIQPKVAKLVVFQRTPTWVLPRGDGEISASTRDRYQRFPAFQKASRAAWFAAYESLIGLPQYVHPVFLRGFEALGRSHLKKQVADPELRKKLTPDFRFNCKRSLISDNWYPALAQDNVHLETNAIAEINANGVKLANGTQHDVDVIIYATGFSVPNDQFNRIKNADGVALGTQFTEQKVGAYYGTNISGYPNFFTMLGPFSAAGNQSAVYMLELQAAYVSRALATMRKQRIQSIDVREDVQQQFVADVHQRSQSVSWVNGGCKSYYQDSSGNNFGLWPNWSFAYRWQTRRFDLDKFHCRRAAKSEQLVTQELTNKKPTNKELTNKEQAA